MHHPVVDRVAHDPRLVAIASRFLVPAAIPFRATLFDKSPDNNGLVVWHQDTALPLRERRDVSGWGPWSVKAGITYTHAPAAALSRVIALRLHIDDSGSDNGPLRVPPGTHTRGVMSDAEVALLARDVHAVDCGLSRRRSRRYAAAPCPRVVQGRDRSAAPRATHRIRRCIDPKGWLRAGRGLTDCDACPFASEALRHKRRVDRYDCGWRPPNSPTSHLTSQEQR